MLLIMIWTENYGYLFLLYVQYIANVDYLFYLFIFLVMLNSASAIFKDLSFHCLSQTKIKEI